MTPHKIILSILFASTVLFTLDAAIPSGYYSTCEGKKKEVLKSQLYTIIKNHDRITYGSGANRTWDAFHYTDVRDDNTWWDIYAETHHPVQPGSSSVSGMNIEHSFPKSWWGGDNNDAYNDIMHLLPVDATANNRRSNFPLAEISGTPSWENGVSKLGSPKSGMGGGSSKVFEPNDEYKGDLARIYFYMVTCYQNLTWQKDGPKTAQQGTYPTLQPWAIDLLLQWHRNDPVSDKEINRNEGVYKKQGNRNPFVDHPELAEYIWGKYTESAWHEGQEPDPEEPKGDPELTSPFDQDLYKMQPVFIGESTTIQIPIIARNFSRNATVMLSGEDTSMFSFIVGTTELQGITLTANQLNRQTGYNLTVKYNPTEICTDDNPHVAAITISAPELQSPITVFVQGTCLANESLMPVVALEPTDETATGYTANWIASAQQIDCYTVYRTVYNITETEVLFEESIDVEADKRFVEITERIENCPETYTVTASINGRESEPGNTVHVAPYSSISTLQTEYNEESKFFTIDGIKLNEKPQIPGIYIMQQTQGKTNKITIK